MADIRGRSRLGQLIDVLVGRAGEVLTERAGWEFFTTENLTVDSTTGGVLLDAAKVKAADRALITVETADIRFYVDGTKPTATVGHQAFPGDQIELHNPTELKNFRAIRVTGTSATARVSYAR